MKDHIDMEQKRYKELEKKYWQGETTIFEEEELTNAFLGGNKDISPALQSVLNEKLKLKAIGIDDSFETDFWAKVEDKEISLTRQVRFRDLFIRVAAAVVLIFGSALIWNSLTENSQDLTQTAHVEDSFEDPEEAFEETKRALLFVSQKLNKGKKPVKEIQRFHHSKMTIVGADD